MLCKRQEDTRRSKCKNKSILVKAEKCDKLTGGSIKTNSLCEIQYLQNRSHGDSVKRIAKPI